MAEEKYKGKYTNDKGELTDAVGTIEYVVPGLLGGVRKALGATPTDTVITMKAEKVPHAVSQKITRTPDGVITERFDNSTGEYVPQINNTYWDDNSMEFYNSAKPVQPWWKRDTNASVNKKQQGGTLQQKDQIKQILANFVAGDAQAQEQVQQLMQQDPKGFYQLLGMLESEGDENASKIKQMIDQQIQSAKQGAKLNYVKELKGICPEGYLAKGGKCEPCEAKKGKKMNAIESFKAQRKKK